MKNCFLPSLAISHGFQVEPPGLYFFEPDAKGKVEVTSTFTICLQVSQRLASFGNSLLDYEDVLFAPAYVLFIVLPEFGVVKLKCERSQQNKNIAPKIQLPLKVY